MDNVIDATQRFSERRLDADVARVNAAPHAQAQELQARVDAYVDALFAQDNYNPAGLP